jgi:hypothetical protein
MPTQTCDGPLEVPSGRFLRYATRYEPARRDACLAWWEGASTIESPLDEAGESASHEAHHSFALLLDISHTGASVAFDEVLPEHTGVWLRLEGDDTTDWTEADVVGVTPTSRGPHLIRLAFRTPCEFETLRAAVCG